MEQEALNPIDQVRAGIIKGRAALEALASEDKYVFHGSGQKLEKLEPRQATNIDTEGNVTPDGPPAVFATPNPDKATFMAILSANDIKGRSGRASFSTENGTIKFKTSTGRIDFDNQETIGYVHVLDKTDFRPFVRGQLASEEEVTPICTVEVRAADLPKVEITDDWVPLKN